ncbi:MAG: hypothetical protein RIT38_52 [Bacteroidota bacterium]|jgi:hypothetical protein
MKLLTKTYILLCCLGFAQNGFSQNTAPNQREFQLTIKPAKMAIKLDGVMDEEAWNTVEFVTDFKKKFPNDIGAPKKQTEVKFLYDDKNLYFGFKVYDSGTAITKSLKRDIGHDGMDGVGIILDPTNQQTNGFYFVLSTLNVQSEDQLSGSSSDGINYSWDSKWFSETKDYGNYWIAEIAIPLKSIRYDANNKNWGVNFVRIDAKNFEYSTWTRISTNFKSYDLGLTGLMKWETNPPVSSNNIILLPYLTGGVSNDKALNETTTNGNVGFDAKIALNSSLNLDLTVNPDFSQVEVDNQVTNLTRYSIFLPERRAFFLENSDLFAGFGIPPIRPFYSRTIGLDKDGNKIPILFGARLSGNLSPDVRIGAMNMQTGRKGDYAPENFSAFTLQKRVLKRSMIKGYFLNRENFISVEEEKLNPLSKYGRNAGFSFDFSNAEGTVSHWVNYNMSIKPTIKDLNSYYEFGTSYNTRKFGFVLDFANVDKNYYTDMGFVQRIENYDAIRDTTIRVGYKHIFSEISYNILPSKGKVGRVESSINNFVVFNPDNSFNEWESTLQIKTDFKNASNLRFNLSNNVTNLLFATSFTDGIPLPAKQYQYAKASFGYVSDTRKLFGWMSEISFGQFYNGKVQGVGAGINWRSQPHLNLRLNAQLNNIQLPGAYGSTKLFLVAPRIEYNFNTKLFWTTFIQYNTQSNNFNINSRLQYRYKPMSDFFLVYTDNYFTDPLFKNKNRALIFKLSYWF